MNRVDFIKELESLLSDIPDSEREEVLQYYNDYFNDAGVENEEAVVESIGTPKQVAASIKAGLAGGEDGEFTENGYKAFEEEDRNVVTEWQSVEQEDARENANNSNQTVSNPPVVKRKLSPLLLIIIIAVCLICAPVVVSIVAGVLATVFGIIIAILAVALGLVVTVVALAVGLLVTGIAVIGAGIAKLFVEPLGGGLLLAMGAVCAGVGLLFSALMVWLIGKAIPVVIRFTVKIIKGLFRRKGEVRS